jgi:hypothetical protein
MSTTPPEISTTLLLSVETIIECQPKSVMKEAQETIMMLTGAMLVLLFTTDGTAQEETLQTPTLALSFAEMDIRPAERLATTEIRLLETGAQLPAL